MKVTFLEPIGIPHEKLIALSNSLQKNGMELITFPDRNEDEAELIKRTADSEIVVVSNIKLSEHYINSCKELKMISVAFTGVDHVDIEACTKKGITVCNAAGYSTDAVAELTLGMIISVYRNISGGDATTRFGGHRAGLLGTELKGKTLGIIGAGAIGTRVAELATAFKCKVVAYSRTKKDLPNVEFVDLDTLLKTSDIVSVHVPLNDETKGLMGKREFTLMKESAIFINTARGPIVESSALDYALNEKEIAGAAVDVYETEPPLPSDHILFTSQNLLMLPHIAYATHEAFDIRADIVVDNVIGWKNGDVKNKVN